MLKFLTQLFGGNKSQKDVGAIQPIIDKINSEFEKLQILTNDELRNRSVQFRARIQEYIESINLEINDLKLRAENEETAFDEKEVIYKQIDQLEKDRDTKIEEVLNEILPEAFAVMKETARRFATNTTLESEATELDRQLAPVKEFITINGTKAIYKNTWPVMGIPMTWNMVHYDVQLIGGVVLHQGKIAEMATGEGKTLVATLPSYLNALTGLGVHIVTVNDYLARRDSEWNAPLLNFLGVTVDCIDRYQPHTPERRNAYLCDITYGTNNEFGFDYLRDNMVRNVDELVQRKLHYAMVDEVDSVLIDDARTPLIISGPVPKGDDQEFQNLKPRVVRLMEAQKKAVNQFINEARKLIEEGKTGPTEGGLALFRAQRGLPKYGNLIKYLSEPGIKQILQKTENYYLQDQQKEMPKADAALYFAIDEKNNQVDMTEKGIELITDSGEDKAFFVMPDVGSGVAEIEKLALSAEEKVLRKDTLLQDFAIKSERIHSVQQLLKAYTLFEKDVEYVVLDGKVKIVDEQTGRILDGRRYSDGLHQAIEAKENVKVEAATQTFATVTLQNFFRMYHKLAGMTGTAETEAGEFWSIYKLDVVVIPTNISIVRKDQEDRIYKTKRAKYKAVIDEIELRRSKGQPVLVGTTSVEVSELLSRMLKLKGVPHNVLNAKQHQREAEIVAEAGKPGAITIATNMAGRGTDIKLGPGVKEAGGLVIIGTERHESRRVDRQLRGRSGRQGDPGLTMFFVSLEDDLMRLFAGGNMAKWMDRLGYKEDDVIEHKMITNSIERAQKKVEENNFGIRKRLLEYDDVMNVQRENIYKKRRHALFGERLTFDLNNIIFDLCDELTATHQEAADFQNYKLDAIRYLSTDPNISEQEFKTLPQEKITETLFNESLEFYHRKNQHIAEQLVPFLTDLHTTRGETIQNVVVPITDGIHSIQVIAPLKKSFETHGKEVVKSFEKSVSLAIIDEAWKEHLRQMDDLKQSVQNAAYEQKDPLLIYKFEAFELFKGMIGEVNRDVCSFLFKGNLPNASPNKISQAANAPQRTDMSRLKAGRDTSSSRITQMPQATQGNGQQVDVAEAPAKSEPVRVGPKVGRNDPCPCGSGKKYKNCHGKETA